MPKRQQDTHQTLPKKRRESAKAKHARGAQQASAGMQQTRGMRQAQGAQQAPGMRQVPDARYAGMRQAQGTQQAQGMRPVLTGRQKSSKRRRVTAVLGVLALLLGACIFAYPSVSNYLFQQNQSNLVAIQAEAVSAISQETLDALYAEAVDYNERLFNSRTVITDPFDANAQTVTDEEYESLLNLNGNGVMATITIPAIDAELVIYHGTTDEVLEKGVGHMQGSSLPVGGESTHVVLAGHTGLPSGQIFDNIDQLEVGDYFIITVLGEELAYSVTSIETVLPEETDSLVIQEGEDLVTLVTCTPYGINTHRLLVHAERCEIPDEWLNGDATASISPFDRTLLPGILIGLALAAAVIVVWRLVSRARTRRAEKQAALAGEAARWGGAAARGAGSPGAAGAGAGPAPFGGVGAAQGAPPNASPGASGASSDGRVRRMAVPEVPPSDGGV